MIRNELHSLERSLSDGARPAPPADPARDGAPRRHPGHAHFWERALSRRAFVGGAGVAGLMLASGLGSKAFATGGQPRPIPGGFQIFGPGSEVFHIFVPGVLDPIDSDRSTIHDFQGDVGFAIIRGAGAGTNLSTGEISPLLFEADMRFFKGIYLSEERRLCGGTFALV